MEKLNYKLPDMTGFKANVAYGAKLPNGEYVLEVERYRTHTSQDGVFAIIGEYRIVEVISQVPTSTPKNGPIPPVVVDQRIDIYMSFGGRFKFGEAEWAGTMDALGVPTAERNAWQEAALGSENVAQGERLICFRNVPKTSFAPVVKAA